MMRRALSNLLSRPRWLAGLVVAVVVLLGAGVLGGGLVARAVHDFSDVSNGAFYHDDVSWLKNNGITLGCGGGKYCPNDPVTRGQMATFLHRMAAVDNTRYFSCAGTAFTAVDSTTGYTTKSIGNAIVEYTSGPGIGRFHCNAVLPHGAVVTAVRFHVRDDDATAEISCQMMNISTVSAITTMAIVGPTGIAATPGLPVLEDTTISDSIVDNLNKSYWLACTISGPSSTVDMRVASVEYTIDGVPAP